MKNYTHPLASHEQLKGYKPVFPRGTSMRPFIKGGDIVWCQPNAPESPIEIQPGDLLWFRNEDNGQFIHRLTAVIDDSDNAAKTVITRGDPMVISETIKPKRVLGKAVYVEARNGCLYSLNKGWTGKLCSLYGKLTELLHTVDRMGKNGSQYDDRKHMFFKGRLFKLFLPFILLPFSVFLNVYLTLAGLLQKQQRLERHQRNIQLLKGVFNREILPSMLTPQDIQLLIDHELAGLYGSEENYQHPAWQNLRDQKKRQLYIIMQLQFFWQQLLKKCEESDIAIIPLKGLSLSLSLYDYDPSVRRVGDIDLLIQMDKLADFATILKEFNYFPKKTQALSSDYQNIKHKAEFICRDPHFPDLDIHTAVVVKKVLTHFTELTIDEVFDRAVTRTSEMGGYKALHPVDEWLYLAYHLVLHHRISGIKWVLDLKLLLDQFDERQWDELLVRAEASGLNKTVNAALHAIELFSTLPEFCTKRPKDRLGFFGKIALDDALNSKTLLKMKNKHGGAGLLSKLDAGIWELHFIDKTEKQLKSVPRFMFPSYAFFTTIFGATPFPLYCLALPFVPVSTILLSTLYAANGLVKSIRLRQGNGK
ncbi:MAG: nucleotidyltransferase family protein [Gammaproteobacteria bacterium]|nr:nucleotidyltransferase family protein [Gammaproteobacteria bacterium]